MSRKNKYIAVTAIIFTLISLTVILINNMNNEDEGRLVLHRNEIQINKNIETLNLRYKEKYKRKPPVNFEKWIEFATNYNCTLDLNDYDQIEHDLKPFRSKIDPKLKTITNELIRMGERKIAKLSLVSISNGKVVNRVKIDKSFFKYILKDIVPILPKKKVKFLVNDDVDQPRVLPDIENITLDNVYYSENRIRSYEIKEALNRSDCLLKKYKNEIPYHGFFNIPDVANTVSSFVTSGLFPVFSPCKLECFKDIIFPFHFNKKVKYLIEDEKVKVPDTYYSKLNQLIWRGTPNGGVIDQNSNYKQFHHRIRLVDWAKNNKLINTSHFKNGIEQVKVNIGFINHAWNKISSRLFLKNNTFKNFMTQQEQYKSKFLAIVDGHAWPNRFASYLLGSRSLVFFNGIFKDWVVSRVRPWMHYVPFSLDLSDLKDKVLWAVANEEKAKKIADEGYFLAKKKLGVTQMKCYAGLLLLEYSDLYHEE